MPGGVILGGWTHRRGDAGGARYLSADLAGAKPRVAWEWKAPAGARIDQVRVAGEHVYAAALGPNDPDAPGWEHVIVYAIDVATGKVAAERRLADPVPVAAMMIEAGVLHVMATRPGEPVFWYALATPSLTPVHRRIVPLDRDPRQADVLDAWASPDGGVWLELSRPDGGPSYAFADAGGASTVLVPGEGARHDAAPRDACAGGRSLYAPGEGALWKLEAGADAPVATAWARSDLDAGRARVHGIVAEGVACMIALAEGAEASRPELQAMAVDRATRTTRWTTPVQKLATGAVGVGARLAWRSGGELLLQCVDADRRACSDLLCVRPDGGIDTVTIGTNQKFLLDAALGGAVLAHYEKKDGSVVLGAFAIDGDGRILGRRAKMLFSLETADVGGGATVYAGAGRIFVRGQERLFAIRV